MKKVLCILILLCLPCFAYGQSIFVDYHVIGPSDQSLFWVLTDPNGVKYRGNCDIALGLDPDAYCEAHKAEWLAEIYAQNADPNTPNWHDTHTGKYLAGKTMINNADTLAKQRAVLLKFLDALYPIAGLPD